MTAPAPRARIAFDSHVHLYKPHWLGPALNTARIAFTTALMDKGDGRLAHGMLALTETAERPSFSLLKEQVLTHPTLQPAPGWTITSLREKLSLAARHDSGFQIFLVSGQQIVTEERLEVLAIGTDQMVENGLPLSSTFAIVNDMGGYSIIPWGVGKWLGTRGALISALLCSPLPFRFSLGDNRGRPALWRHIPQFDSAREKGIPILRGSDPLPLPSQEQHIGSYGTIVEIPFDPLQPAASLLSALQKGPLDSEQLNHFGASEGLFTFIANQIRLRTHKQTG